MHDLKNPKGSRVKDNRLRQEKAPRDWRRLFHRTLRAAVFAFCAVLLVGGGGLAAQVLLDSGYFRIDGVRVEKNHRVSQEEIIALSDIRLGSSIFDLDLAMIGRKIEENPWIARARVERIFPRQVVIRVEEREPKAVINLGYLYYVDGDGEVFKLLTGDDRLDFPVITGIDRAVLLQDPGQTRGRIKTAMTLVEDLAGRRFFNLEDVSEIHCDADQGFTLYTYQGGVPVRLGQTRFGPKLDRLERIYKELEPRLPALKFIDLNVADRVIVKVDARRQTGRG